MSAQMIHAGMQTRIIAIANQKGGVGKTTTAVNLAASLGASEKSTLLIDLDPQANATSGIGLEEPVGSQKQLYHVLLGDIDINEAVQASQAPFLDVLPATGDLIGFEVEGLELEDREMRLAKSLAKLTKHYDYILIDCPPSLSLLTVNALSAAGDVLVPLQAEYYALEGLGRLTGTIDLIKENINPRLQLMGIVLTMFDGRNRLSHQVQEEVQSYFGDVLWKTVIPRNVKLSEAPSFGKPVLLYAISSKGAQSYLRLANELIAHCEPQQTQATKKEVANERQEKGIGTGHRRGYSQISKLSR